MKRKLVKQGAATMMISLPSKWIKENKLDKGDEVDLEETSKGLVISTSEKDKEKEIILEITKKNTPELRTLLTHSYRQGFNRILIKGEITSLSQEISRITANVLMGFEVIERKKEQIVLENISNLDETKYSAMLSKIILLISEMPELIINDIENKTEEVQDTKDQCDKFVLFCRRIINLNKNDFNPVLEWEFLTFLTHIQHSYFYLYEYLKKNKLKLNSKSVKLIRESRIYFSKLSEAYTKKDILIIHEINSLKNKLQEDCLDELTSSKGKEIVVAAYLREIFRLIQIGSSPVLAEILDEKIL